MVVTQLLVLESEELLFDVVFLDFIIIKFERVVIGFGTVWKRGIVLIPISISERLLPDALRQTCVILLLQSVQQSSLILFLDVDIDLIHDTLSFIQLAQQIQSLIRTGQKTHIDKGLSILLHSIHAHFMIHAFLVLHTFAFALSWDGIILVLFFHPLEKL